MITVNCSCICAESEDVFIVVHLNDKTVSLESLLAAVGEQRTAPADNLNCFEFVFSTAVPL